MLISISAECQPDVEGPQTPHGRLDCRELIQILGPKLADPSRGEGRHFPGLQIRIVLAVLKL